MNKIYGEIVAVVPEYCVGPGWANTPVWVYYRDDNQQIYQRCIQPDDQTPELVLLFDLGASIQSKLKAAVLNMQRGCDT